MNDTITNKRHKIVKRIIELSQEDPKYRKQMNGSLSSYGSSQKTTHFLDPELVALFPKSFRKRDSEIVNDILKPNNFKSTKIKRNRLMRQSTVFSPTEKVGILEEAKFMPQKQRGVIVTCNQFRIILSSLLPRRRDQ